MLKKFNTKPIYLHANEERAKERERDFKFLIIISRIIKIIFVQAKCSRKKLQSA